MAIRVELSQNLLIRLRTPSIEYGRLYDRGLCADVLRLEPQDLIDVAPQLVSAGNPTVFIPVKHKRTVDRAFIDLHGLRTLKGADHEPMCVFIFTPTCDGAYSRMFALEYGIPEDPATGSACAATIALLATLSRDERAELAWRIHQGVAMGRPSLLLGRTLVRDSTVIATHIGGRCVLVHEGTFTL